jgi:hypothetical protein
MTETLLALGCKLSASRLEVPPLEYQGRKAIPAELLTASEPKGSTAPVVQSANSIVSATLRQKLIRPALGAQSADEFMAFWYDAEHISSFEGFRFALRDCAEEAEKAGTYSRKEVGAKFLHHCHVQAGRVGRETHLRWGIADATSAYEIVSLFPSREPLNTVEDTKAALHYNWCNTLVDALLVCLAEANHSIEVVPEVAQCIPEAIGIAGEILYDHARSGAKLRDLTEDAIAIRLDWAHAGWEKPCQAFFEYLAERAPRHLPEFVNSKTLTSGMRARAAEAVGHVSDSAYVRELLLPLLADADTPTIVAEAAIYGLESHLDAESLAQLRTIADDTESPSELREAASEALALS